MPNSKNILGNIVTPLIDQNNLNQNLSNLLVIYNHKLYIAYLQTVYIFK